MQPSIVLSSLSNPQLRKLIHERGFLFHSLRVRTVEPDMPEAVVVSFDALPALREAFGFT